MNNSKMEMNKMINNFKMMRMRWKNKLREKIKMILKPKMDKNLMRKLNKVRKSNKDKDNSSKMKKDNKLNKDNKKNNKPKIMLINKGMLSIMYHKISNQLTLALSVSKFNKPSKSS